jgi:DNA-binding NtrC family response regulator
MRRRPEEEGWAAPGKSSGMFGNKRVMVVEDDEIVRATLAELLQYWGYETATACDGLDALGKMPSFQPGIVISDLQMPRMGGMELLEALRVVPDVDCIIITGCDSRERADAVTALGAIDYLEKPVDLERLRADLQRCAHPVRVQARLAV